MHVLQIKQKASLKTSVIICCLTYPEFKDRVSNDVCLSHILTTHITWSCCILRSGNLHAYVYTVQMFIWIRRPGLWYRKKQRQTKQQTLQKWHALDSIMIAIILISQSIRQCLQQTADQLTNKDKKNLKTQNKTKSKSVEYMTVSYTHLTLPTNREV